MTAEYTPAVGIAILAAAVMTVASPSVSAQRNLGEVLGRSARVVELPAGSIDGLAAAISQAGPRGVVLVRSGMHTESGTVTIDIPVWIVGEAGAVLEVDTCPDPNQAFNLTIDAALHVLGANKVVIWGLEILPTPTHAGACVGLFAGAGGTAILVENASHAVIGRNVIRDHQVGILLHHGDHATIRDNTITGVYPRMFPAIFFSAGVLVLNGDRVGIQSNDVSGTVAGIFTGDVGGKALFNRSHGNLIGVVL